MGEGDGMPTEMSGMTVATESSAAAGALAEGIRGFNHWRADAMEHIDRALAADPQFPFAHAVKGLILAGARSNQYRPLVEAAREAARSAERALSRRESLYVDALDAALDGRLNEAVVRLEAVLDDHPTDLLAHRLAQQELFWGGEARWMADIAERAAPAWRREDPEFGMFQSVRAFSLEEAGFHDLAERCGREAVELDPHDCWGTHAIAHVLTMQGRVDEGIAWLDGLSGGWSGANQIVHHLWWHLCLFLLERGEHERILELLDREIRNPDSPLVKAVPDAYIDLQNVASLLVRLELRGVDVGGRWESVAEVAGWRIGDHASPFTDAHCAMILAANGRLDDARALVESMAQFAASDQGTLGPRYRAAAIPAAQAAIAHRGGDHEAVLQHLLPARRGLWQMGGSHAQRDVFTHILADSCHRLGRDPELNRLRAEALATGFAPGAISAPALALA